MEFKCANPTPPLGTLSPAKPQETPHPLSTEGSGERSSLTSDTLWIHRLPKACHVPSRLSAKVKPNGVTALNTCFRVLGLPAQRFLDRGLRNKMILSPVQSREVPRCGQVSFSRAFFSAVCMTAFSLFLPGVNEHLSGP